MRNPETRLTFFQSVNLDKIKSIFSKAKLTSCENNSFNISDLKNSVSFDCILMIIMEIVNLCIKKRIFPKSEKLAIIKPVVKGVLDSQTFSSYRPVSNLSFLSKMLECAILEQLLCFLQERQVLPDDQSAYKQLYSTETALCSVVI